MHFFNIISVFTLTLLCIFYVILGQQPYTGSGTTDCSIKGNSNSIRGYTCNNGLNPSCQAYLTFRSQTQYNSVRSISALLGSDPSQISEANSVSQDSTFESNKLLLVPVNCSCVGNQYYQFNTSYLVKDGDTYFSIANNTFEGLSTCHAMQDQNSITDSNLQPGNKLVVPLRCACPGKNQTDKGVKYLLSYLVTWGDDVSHVSERFGVSTQTTLEANDLSLQQSTINPFTTLLVPLQDKPSSSQTVQPPPPPPSPPPPPPPTDGSSSKTWIYVVVGVVAGIVLILVLCAIIFRKHFHKQDKTKGGPLAVSESFVAIEKTEGKKIEEESETLSEIISGIAQSFKVYSFKELQSATNDFSPSSLIKGSVYCGVINGDMAAIRKIDRDVSKEVELLSKVNHSNVIRLSGISFNEGYWYLVYEYAANGCLSDWIYMNNMNGKKSFSWTHRIQIALDVATGLYYLHSFTSPPYIHKDLKCSNILLDSEFRAKITNFGLARPVEADGDQFPMTRHIFGTRGYLAPEYLENGIVSTKLDVFAFGVMMLEILTGKEVSSIYAEDNNKKNLLDILSAILNVEGENERLRNIMDPSLQGNYATELAIFIVGMIENCIKNDPTSRPSMQEIVSSLSKALVSSLSWEKDVHILEEQSVN